MMPSSKTDISSSFSSWRWLCKHTNSFLQVSISRRRWRWWVDSPFVCCESSGREQSHSNTRKKKTRKFHWLSMGWENIFRICFSLHSIAEMSMKSGENFFFNEKLWAKNVKILFTILPRPPAHSQTIVPCSRFIWIPKPHCCWVDEENFLFEFKMKMAKILCHACEIKEVARNRSGDERWAQGRRIETKKNSKNPSCCIK